MAGSQDYLIGDIPGLRNRLFEKALRSVATIPPITQAQYSLRIENPDYEDPLDVSPDVVKDALINRRTVGRRIRGTVVFEHPGGVVKKKTTLLTVPTLTDRGTFIIDGVEYSMVNQQRLRPGIYVRRKLSGEPESYVNLAAGKTHRYVYDPDSSVFYLEFGQSRIPLYSLLHQIGVDDETLRKHWGADVLARNQQAHNPNAVAKLARRLGIPKPEDMKRYLMGLSVDPAVMRRNLGIESDYISPDVVLAATTKMLGVYRGDVPEDDRDALVNQTIWSPAELFGDAVAKSQHALRKVLWRLMRNPSASIPAHLLDQRVRFVFHEARLSDVADGVNPLDRLDRAFRLTRMGEGGIGNIEAVPDTSRNIHPTHFGFIDPTTTPESLRVGIDTRIATNTRLAADGKLKSAFVDVKTGKTVWLTPEEIAEAVVTFPGELDSNEPYIAAIHKGKETLVPRESAQYVLAATTDMYGPLANMIPFKAATFPQRIAMGSRMLTQALPLINREAPLVQSADGKGRPFVGMYGAVCGAAQAPVNGVVQQVTPNKVVIRGDDRQEYTFPLVTDLPQSSMTGLTIQPLVAAGQRVQVGQPITASNYTDSDGNVAVGINARIAYIPTGETYEDAFVISESFAKKLTSEHLTTHALDDDPSLIAGKTNFVGLFPGKYTTQQLSVYDERGIIKPGTVVTKDTPLILAAAALPLSTAGSRRRLIVDGSVTWPYDVPGTVVGAFRRDGGVTVLVRSFWPTQTGDKIAGLYGNKGIVVVKPDDQVPRDRDGNPYDIIANPLGIISRGNVGQVYEALLGKVAEKRGRPVLVRDFAESGRLREFVEQQLRNAGLEATEEVFDPITGTSRKALAGRAYFLKLEHTADEKLQGVGTAHMFTAEGVPLGGEGGKAKRLGLLELNALLAHNAYATITDASLIRGQQDEQLWRMFMSGHALPPPKIPLLWTKLVNMLNAAGINPVYGQKSIRLFALTNKDVDTLVGGRYVQKSETVRVKGDDFVAPEGGLFDERLTGGLAGTKWAGIRLPEPLPSPVMVEPLSRLLDVTPGRLERILVGRETPPTKWGVSGTGPQAVYAAVNKLNIDKEIAACNAELQTATKTRADALTRKLSYLEVAKRLQQHPKDWFWTTVPVLPPLFRPISVLQDGTLIVNDANYLYKELFDATQVLRTVKEDVADPTIEREAVWHALKAVVGLDEPYSVQLRQQGIRGILATVAGTSPKAGMMQRKLLSVAAAVSGRGVIAPNPQLTIDQIGLPEDIAWEVYKPFAVRELVRRGLSLRDAMQKVKARDNDAAAALNKVIGDRPILVNRAPVLHKYGIMAFTPVITKNKVIEVCPLVTQAFGADFDGDTMQFHVPVSDAAVREAYERLLPSRNLISAATLHTPVFMPSQEFLFGLWWLSRKPDLSKPVRTFRSKEDAIAAYRRGDVAVDQPIRIVTA